MCRYVPQSFLIPAYDSWKFFLLSAYLLSKFCMAFLKAQFHLLIRNKQLLFSTDVTIFDLDSMGMVPYVRANIEQKICYVSCHKHMSLPENLSFHW
jgi:hypothetical protein